MRVDQEVHGAREFQGQPEIANIHAFRSLVKFFFLTRKCGVNFYNVSFFFLS